MAAQEYIDYELFLDPHFSPHQFANSLVLNTNNPTDTPLDLSTPLSRVLFDKQDVDSHIHALTTSKALPLLTHTQKQNAAATRIGVELDAQVGGLNQAYKRLEEEVIVRYEVAEELRQVSERLWHTVRLGRTVGRALQLGRQLEIQMAELQASISASKATAKEDHRAMIRASNTIVTLRTLFDNKAPGEEGEGLERVHTMQTLHSKLLSPSERTVNTRASQLIREFSMSNLSSAPGSGSNTYMQSEETKSRTTSAFLTLYILSPAAQSLQKKGEKGPEGETLIVALHDYLRTALTSSLASLVRALGTLPQLEKMLLEISARCQNIVALEMLLDSIAPPKLPSQAAQGQDKRRPSIPSTNHATLLHPLLASLETSSLPSYFWRTLASNLSGKVSELMNKGGVQARTLRTRKDFVRDSIRECVIRGSQPPAGAHSSMSKKGRGSENWEREAAVMVGSVIGHLGR